MFLLENLILLCKQFNASVLLLCIVSFLIFHLYTYIYINIYRCVRWTNGHIKCCASGDRANLVDRRVCEIGLWAKTANREYDVCRLSGWRQRCLPRRLWRPNDIGRWLGQHGSDWRCVVGPRYVIWVVTVYRCALSNACALFAVLVYMKFLRILLIFRTMSFYFFLVFVCDRLRTAEIARNLYASVKLFAMDWKEIGVAVHVQTEKTICTHRSRQANKWNRQHRWQWHPRRVWRRNPLRKNKLENLFNFDNF